METGTAPGSPAASRPLAREERLNAHLRIFLEQPYDLSEEPEGPTEQEVIEEWIARNAAGYCHTNHAQSIRAVRCWGTSGPRQLANTDFALNVSGWWGTRRIKMIVERVSGNRLALGIFEWVNGNPLNVWHVQGDMVPITVSVLVLGDDGRRTTERRNFLVIRRIPMRGGRRMEPQQLTGHG